MSKKTEQSIGCQIKNTMSRIGLLAIGAVLTFALSTAAQESPNRRGDAGGVQKDSHEEQRKNDAHLKADGSVSLPTVHEQLKVLTQKLELTSDQQAKTKTILLEMDGAVQKLMQDKTLAPQELLDKVRPWRAEANKKLQEILSEDQKKKLDQYLKAPHAEMHGNLSGATTSPQKPAPKR